MPSIKVNVSPHILDWIYTAASFDGVDDTLRSDFHKWKNEEEQPTYAQIEFFSKKIHIPLGYFFLKTPPVEHLPLLNFRTLDSVDTKPPSRDLVDTYYQISAIQTWMRDYLIAVGNGKLSFVGSCKDEKNPTKITAAIRTVIGMAADWYTESDDKRTSFNILRDFFEKAGILVLQNGVVGQNTHRPLSIDEFRAFVLIDDYAPLVFINNTDTEGGKLFSLLHEAVHVWLGLHSFYNDNTGHFFNVSQLETICNTVAAELLVPNDHFINEWSNQTDPSVDGRIDNIAEHFRCGSMTIARRALDNNYINQPKYEEIVADLATCPKKKDDNKSRGNYYSTAKARYGASFILALDNSIKEGKTTYTEAFRLTNTSRKTFDTLVKKVKDMVK
jgi:Zn-dependent peptidase ImmA (M78 family)